ncbi:MAG: chitinase [Cetobacterium sp.]
MNPNNEIDFQVNDLKSKISSLFDKFKTLQTNMNLIIDIVSSNPEYNTTKNKLESLVSLSNNLNSFNSINEFYEIKALAYDVEKMIFDLENIIETESPEILIPEIKTALLQDAGNTLIGTLKDVFDPEIRLNNIEYKLYKETSNGSSEVAYIPLPESLFNIDFKFREAGTFYFIATYYYDGSKDVIESKSITSNKVVIQIVDKKVPSICCAALTNFANTPKGLLTKIVDTDSAITEVIYTLKNTNNFILETITKNNPFDHIQFSRVNEGNYFFNCNCKYNIGSRTGEILLNSNVINIKGAIIIPPEPEPNPEPEPEPNPNPVTKWPRGIFAPFVDAARDDVNFKFAFADESKKTGVQFYNLGFITADSNKNPAWAGNTMLPGNKGTNAGLMQDVERLRSMGGDVCISFGGLNGPYLNEVTSDVNDLKNKYKSVIDAWNLNRVDFDMEHNRISGNETCNENKINHSAIKLLQTELASEERYVGIWFTLPVMPYGLNQAELLLLDDAIKKGVEIEGVNVMAMCYGPAYAGNMAEQSISAMTNLHSQLKTLYTNNGIFKSDDELWGMVGICPEIGINDTGSFNTFYLEDVSPVLQFCKTKNVGMITFWSANRDKKNNGSEANGPDSTGLVQEELAFSKAFQAYNNTNENVKSLTKSLDCGVQNGIPVWHQSMTYPTSNTKVFYKGKYYVNGWFVSAWDNSPTSNEAWREVSL